MPNYILVKFLIKSGHLFKRYDRNEMFDFIPIVVDGLCLTMYPQPPEYDVGLFVRPYRKERWGFIYTSLWTKQKIIKK